MTTPISTSRRRFVTGLASTTALGIMHSNGIAQASRSSDGIMEEVAEDNVDAARNPRGARRPEAPTKAMVLAYELHHAEYREW